MNELCRPYGYTYELDDIIDIYITPTGTFADKPRYFNNNYRIILYIQDSPNTISWHAKYIWRYTL